MSDPKLVTPEFCECVGNRRNDGFTNVGPVGKPWWVCAGCRMPTRPYALAMRSNKLENPGE
jgi:hypothetical protein